MSKTDYSSEAYIGTVHTIKSIYDDLPLITAYRRNLEHINKLYDVNAITYNECLDLKVINIYEHFNRDGRGKNSAVVGG